MRQEIMFLSDMLHNLTTRYEKEFGKYHSEIGKVDQIEKGLKETYGKVILIEENLKTSDNKLEKTREQLRDTIIILQKHKEKISKLP